MPKSFQQAGQHRLETAIMLWSVFCETRQIGEHIDRTAKTLPEAAPLSRL